MDLREAERRLWQALRVERDEDEALDLLRQNPELARSVWPDEDEFIAGSTALHYAAHRNFPRAVRLLLELGADKEAHEAKWYRTPLSWAADTGAVETTRLLLEQGARAEADIGKGYIALHAAASGGEKNGAVRPEDYVTVAKILVEEGSDPESRSNAEGKTPLQVAESSGNIGVAEYLRGIKAVAG